MQIFFLGLSLIGLWIGASVYLRLPVWFVPFFVTCSIIVVLYAAALFGFPYPVAISIYLLGFVCLMHVLQKIIWDKLDPGTAVYFAAVLLVLICFYVRLANDFQFLGWDEFSHWALAVKNLLADQALWGATSNIQFKAYAPGTAVLQYYFAFFGGRGEAAQLIGIDVLIASAITATIGPAIRQPIVALLLAGLCVFLCYLLGYSLYDIYVDHTLGFVFAATLSASFSLPRNWIGVLALVPPIVTLLLIKHVGLLLGLVVVAAVTCSQLWRDRSALRELKMKAVLAAIAPGVLLLASILAASWTWKNYVAGIGETTQTITLRSLLGFLFAPDERSLVIQAEFTNRFFNGSAATVWLPVVWPDEIGISLAKVFFVLVAATLALAALVRQSRVVISLGVLTAGSIGYLLVLLAAYRYYFGEYEGRILTSFERYFGTYLLAWGVVLLGILCRQIAIAPQGVRIAASAALAMIFLASPVGLRNTVFLGPEQRTASAAKDAKMRGELETIANVLLPQTSRKSVIYYVDQDTTGYSYYLFRYLVAPLATNKWCWSLGKPYRESDLWTCDKEMAKEWRDYSFVVTYNADAQFWQRYGAIFDPKDRGARVGIYRITWLGDASVQLERIGP
ncbi:MULTISPECIES: hypothetical protein [Phyllobacteriaceae]|uniref:Glycosyltransferase RgtA/B/C/D-like domain-containing protein n=1 Tax=Mesorhizobium hungaricum TaxID=1566387 RepID=A0A1C2DCL2_9HYPH|nr:MULTISPECIES: hypothetical protein [Mesorhizobium]MBN9237661.1 hypothetical protein [Mesorhizobium sp.]MDQ0330992.1 hypothetical protein [Mesorhizobium sp. YL-MeA3-2017]OCX12479.1 hypothetical protein QV13_22960 [Mesorhizobium hungaricum]